ncbi:proteinase-activated receptor 2-like [Lineus longissimus]|uniref:proteinase-activated receptor 2-like n=1 Tax=Lineus longissimus TaxID=88925 RepID=UPI002B4F9667
MHDFTGQPFDAVSADNVTGLARSSYVELLELVTSLLYRWFTVVVIGLGVPGNIMSLLITLKQDNRHISTCIYMAGLAIVDTGLLIMMILYKTLRLHGQGLDGNWTFLTIMWYGGDGFAIISGLFLAEMSIDRAIAIMYPMKAATICTASRAVKVTLATAAIELFLQAQAFIVLTVPDPPNGALIVNFPAARWYEAVYNAYLVAMGTVLPFSVLVVCNITIIIGVSRAARKRRKIKSGKDKKINETNLTAMLFMTSFAYFVCSCPKRINQAVFVYDLNDPYWRAMYWLQFWVCNEIWHINFAINFYVYFLGGGKKFRRDAREIVMKFFYCCWAK